MNSLMTIFSLSISAFTILSGLSVNAQTIVIQGIIKDNLSLETVSHVNIKINSTKEGVFTNQDGRFTLSLKRLPASITISCVGYEPLYYDIDKIPAEPLELLIRRTTYTLKEVDIKASQYNYVLTDRTFSVLDYEIMDGRLLLLVFRYRLKYTELVLLSITGDTLAVAPVPELKPQKLYKDFLGNIHYISAKGNAFQCHYNENLKTIGFPFSTTFDSLLRIVQPFLFRCGNRLYFQEFTPDGLGTSFGYYDQNRHKEYFKTIQDESSRKRYSDDVRFYNRWNEVLQGNQESLSRPEDPENPNPSSLTHSNLSILPLVDEIDMQANKLFNYRRIHAPMMKLGEDKIAVFRFSEGVIELMNEKGDIYRTVPIEFRTETDDNLLAGLLKVFVPVAEWEWSGKIITDEYYRDVYTTYTKNGLVQIRKIDLETGKLTRRIDIPFPFPQQIEIFQGNAYFLKKDIGKEYETWKLVKVRL